MGSLASAVASYLDARAYDGEWLLRIDNIDPPREDPDAMTSFGPMLLAHGLEFDGLIIYQGERFDHYRHALTKLDTFACGCSRKDLEIYGGAAHPPPCLNAEHLPAIRHMRAPFDVLWRRDDLPSYHLACAVDEIEMGITHVLRGDDLRFADDIQATLIQELGGIPPSYACVPVVRQPNGQKLSKQNLAPALIESEARSQLQAALAHLFPERTWDGTISAMLTRATDQWRRIHEL